MSKQEEQDDFVSFSLVKMGGFPRPLQSRRRGKGLGIWFGGVSGRNFRVAQDCFPYTTWSTVLILLSFLPGTI